jgi:hypothetical protein
LEARSEISRIQGDIPNFRRQIHNLGQKSEENISAGHRLLIDRADEISLTIIGQKILTLSGLTLHASASPLISLPGLMREERRLCETAHKLIRRYSLSLDPIEPIGDQVLKIGQMKYSAFAVEIDADLHRLDKKLEAVGMYGQILDCQEKIKCLRQEKTDLIGTTEACRCQNTARGDSSKDFGIVRTERQSFRFGIDFLISIGNRTKAALRRAGYSRSTACIDAGACQLNR